MKLVGLMPVRNEDWILGLSARVALMWCDELVVLLHECDDDSKDILRDIDREDGTSGRMSIEWVPGVWREMQHRQDMLNRARLLGATHIAMIDADEVLTGNLVAAPGRWAYMHRYISLMPPGFIAHLPLYNLRGGIDRYHANGTWGHRTASVAFADDPRLGWSGDRFHLREPQGAPLKPYQPIQHGQGGVMHLWGASERRLVAKHALYKVTERLRWPARPVDAINAQYNVAIRGTGAAGDWVKAWTYEPVPASWWAPYAHLQQYLYVDAKPWQEAEVRRLVKEHGAETFRGLDLFGLA